MPWKNKELYDTTRFRQFLPLPSPTNDAPSSPPLHRKVLLRLHLRMVLQLLVNRLLLSLLLESLLLGQVVRVLPQVGRRLLLLRGRVQVLLVLVLLVLLVLLEVEVRGLRRAVERIVAL